MSPFLAKGEADTVAVEADFRQNAETLSASMKKPASALV
jgi:hypothetical protein